MTNGIFNFCYIQSSVLQINQTELTNIINQQFNSVYSQKRANTYRIYNMIPNDKLLSLKLVKQLNSNKCIIDIILTNV